MHMGILHTLLASSTVHTASSRKLQAHMHSRCILGFLCIQAHRQAGVSEHAYVTGITHR